MIPRRRFLLLGLAPNPATASRPDLWLLPDGTGIPHAANRLLQLSGFTLQQYVDVFRRDNLLHYVPSLARPLSRDAAKGRLPVVFQSIIDWQDLGVVLLGSWVTDVWLPAGLLRRHFDPFTWYERSAARLEHLSCSGLRRQWVNVYWAYIPHPSGRSRAWSDPELQTRARSFLQDLHDHYLRQKQPARR